MPKKQSKPPITPGEMLKEGFLEDLNLTQVELAHHLKWTPAKVNEIIQGKRRITIDIALALADVFQTTPEFWLNAQWKTDLHKALQKHTPYKPIKKAS